MNGDAPGADSGSNAPVPEIHPDGGWPSLDAALDVLANQRRRYALYYLQDQTTATLREVAHQVAIWESEGDTEAVESVSIERVYIDFYHHHLPKLADASVVDYDPREELVRYDCPDLLEGVLDVVKWVEHPGTDSD